MDYSVKGKTIYTSDSSLPYVKKATHSFLKNMENNIVKDMVAVVSFSSSTKIVSDFTNDFNLLKTRIDSIQKSDNRTNISIGLQKAKELLSEYKNIKYRNFKIP